jgi:predicted TIM-barrel fold metal-dependent hydrolase
MSDETSVEMDQPAIVVSCDSHAGPKLREQLREYCPHEYLEQFDEDAAAQAKQAEGMLGAMSARMSHPNLDRDGHWDPQARLRDMDSDGVAAELIWHFSQNGENLPWIGQGLGTVFKHQLELGAVAYDIYNRWLADFCSEDAERLLGLVYIPSWDIDASIKTLEWAREHGLRCLNFPAPSRPGVTEYNDPAWDPFWSACTDLGFALSTHSSGGPFFDFTRGPGGMQIIAYEGGSWLARRGVWILTYGEVFQRHPELKLVITEQVEGWYVPTMHELDSFYLTFGLSGGLTKLPSEYMRQNVFLGASFISPWQAEDAVEHDYVDNVLWGRDYPHIEGVFQATREPDEEPMTKLALRHVFSRIPTGDALKILGGNAMKVFGLDETYLRAVADRIGASTPAQLAIAPDPATLPPNDGNGFIGQSGPRPVEPERVQRAERRRAQLQPASTNVV